MKKSLFNQYVEATTKALMLQTELVVSSKEIDKDEVYRTIKELVDCCNNLASEYNAMSKDICNIVQERLIEEA